MPMTAETFIRLTPVADTLIARGGGRLASDAARAARRAGELMGDRAVVRLGALMRGGGMTAPDIAELMRAGVLAVVEADPHACACERCNRPATPGTSLCSDCRRYLGWARLVGEAPPQAPGVVEPCRVAARRGSR